MSTSGCPIQRGFTAISSTAEMRSYPIPQSYRNIADSVNAGLFGRNVGTDKRSEMSF